VALLMKEVNMKFLCVFAAVLVSLLVVLSTTKTLSEVSAKDGKKLPEIITLGTEAKLGSIKFSHIDHTTKNRSIEGSKISCIECHHVAQPAAEAAKHPPLKTAWPVDRTTTLTAELFEKDPTAAQVAVCRDCHARAEMKPKLLAEVPQIKLEVGTELITLVNQQAFHRNCAGCHDEIVKTSKDLNPPTSKKCTACHKRTAA
jgi:cytochrome c553